MRPEEPVRGLRRLELITPQPLAVADFHAETLGWIVLPAADGTVGCWVGDRLAAHLRTPQPGENPGWRPIFGDTTARAATLTDNQGSTAGIDNGRVQHGPWAPPPRPGEPCWLELNTADQPYWTDRLRWTHRVTGEYDTAGRPIAGTRDSAPIGWTCYFGVENLEHTIATAIAKGGAQHPEIPATIIDPAGTTLTLLESATGWGGHRTGSETVSNMR